MVFELEECCVEVVDFELGMFVLCLDVLWELIDFLLQGVQLISFEDIVKLCELCEFVYVDVCWQVMLDILLQIFQCIELFVFCFEVCLGYSDQVLFDDEVLWVCEVLESVIVGVQQVFEDVFQGCELLVELVECVV